MCCPTYWGSAAQRDYSLNSKYNFLRSQKEIRKEVADRFSEGYEWNPSFNGAHWVFWTVGSGKPLFQFHLKSGWMTEISPLTMSVTQKEDTVTLLRQIIVNPKENWMSRCEKGRNFVFFFFFKSLWMQAI